MTAYTFAAKTFWRAKRTPANANSDSTYVALNNPEVRSMTSMLSCQYDSGVQG